jgi:tripartite-type tricarboxylate transporter receptor subunit TctC
VVSTPDEFAGQIKEEIETWGKVIRAAHIKGQ